MFTPQLKAGIRRAAQIRVASHAVLQRNSSVLQQLQLPLQLQRRAAYTRPSAVVVTSRIAHGVLSHSKDGVEREAPLSICQIRGLQAGPGALSGGESSKSADRSRPLSGGNIVAGHQYDSKSNDPLHHLRWVRNRHTRSALHTAL